MEAIAWADQNGLEDDSPLLLSPTPAESDDFEDSDDWETAPRSGDSDESSEDNSAEARGKWAKIDLAPVVVTKKIRYLDIRLPAERLMAEMQRFFSQEQFDWFHPSDMELIAKSEDRHLFTRFVAGYQNGSQMITLSMICVTGKLWAFDKFRPQMREFFEGVLGTAVCELVDDEEAAGRAGGGDVATAPPDGT
jgi:hypothetical protein